MNYSDKKSSRVGGTTGFKPIWKKERLAYSITPEQKYYMQRKAGSATNRHMRARTLADYGLALDKDVRSRYHEKYFGR